MGESPRDLVTGTWFPFPRAQSGPSWAIEDFAEVRFGLRGVYGDGDWSIMGTPEVLRSGGEEMNSPPLGL